MTTHPLTEEEALTRICVLDARTRDVEDYCLLGEFLDRAHLPDDEVAAGIAELDRVGEWWPYASNVFVQTRDAWR